MKKGLIIAIDGPVGAGKSTVARLIADRFGFLNLDSGAMYRAVAWKTLDRGIQPRDEAAMSRLCLETTLKMTWEGRGMRISVDGTDVTEKIRTPEISQMASTVSLVPAVRDYLGRLQREIGWKEALARGGVVMEGRDIGTIVFPDASVKFYLDGDPRDRGKRRWEELRARGTPVDLEETIREVERRDKQDRERKIAPLRKAEDAHLLDTTGLTPDAVVDRMVSIIRSTKL